VKQAHRFDWHVAAILLVALGLRLLVWRILPYRSFVSDEAEYLAAATWLAQGRGFSFFLDWIWTRPPFYLLFLAAHVGVWGPETLWPIRFSQALLSVLSVWLTMQLASHLAPDGVERRVALTAGWAMALTYSFASYAFLLLSETLFITLLLAALLALTIWGSENKEQRTKNSAANALVTRHSSLATRYLWSHRWLIVGGVLLGLAALTRALLAGVLPLFALWVGWQAGRVSGVRYQVSGIGHEIARTSRFSILNSQFSTLNSLGAAALLTLVVSAIILPWSVYNSRFYGGSILIDTTGGYNAMLGAQAARQEIAPAPECEPVNPPRCEESIYNTLIAIPNHAERQQVANRTALEWIGQNPIGFVRKAGVELLDLLLVNYGGAERFTRGYTVGYVPAPHLLGLLLDDTLYVLALPLAALGLFRRQGRVGKGLIVAWLLFNLLTGPLFFAINRFRQPLLPFLFIYAACGFWQLRAGWASRPRWIVAYGTAAMLALLLLPSYTYWPFSNDRRGVIHDTLLGFRGLVDAGRCADVERLINAGRLDEAQALHDAEDARRLDNSGRKTPRHTCLALLNARMLALRGQPDQALALLQSMDQIPERYLMEGDIYRATGNLDRARGAFVAQRLEPANPTRWAWEHLRPPPTSRIDLGSGLDWGYIDGVYQREWPQDVTTEADIFARGYRWTTPHARLRFVGAGTGSPQTLHLRLAGFRPAGFAPPTLRVQMNSETFETVVVSPSWQEIAILLPPTPRGEDVLVDLRSTTFVPGPDDLHQYKQLRLLGVQLDWAELKDEG
jgi:4-amino-4-deoxy-L-arabinose transferase-like glycosyltransferase